MAESSVAGTNPEPQPINPDIRTPTNILFLDSERQPAFTFDNGGEHTQRSILETLGGGVAVIDFDRDGSPDLCFAGGGRFEPDGDRLSIKGTAPGLFRNFQTTGGNWNCVSQPAGLTEAKLYSLGVSAADFNNDGFPDFCVTGHGTVCLYQNQGDGVFAECALASGLNDAGFSASAAWGDLNADGALDLYVAHYVVWDLNAETACQIAKKATSEICGPKSFAAESDRVFFGRGDGTFEDQSMRIGLQPGGKGLGVVIGDVDIDGDMDIYVANDTTANFLYLNNGRGKFEESAALHGVAYDENGRPTGSMGTALSDYDNDGLPDLWTTNFEFEALALFRNLGHAQFHQVSRPAGVTAMTGEYVSWGTAFADFDADGKLDIVVTNGHLPDYVPLNREAQVPFLLVNKDLKRFNFAKAPEGSYFNSKHRGRGLAVGDFDLDGRQDIVISHLSGPARVLRNETPLTGSVLRVRLVGRGSNRDACGATAILETTNGSFLRQLTGGGSYLSTSEAILHWGLPDGTVPKKLTIRWPSGKTQIIDRFRAVADSFTSFVLDVCEP